MLGKGILIWNFACSRSCPSWPFSKSIIVHILMLIILGVLKVILLLLELRTVGFNRPVLKRSWLWNAVGSFWKRCDHWVFVERADSILLRFNFLALFKHDKYTLSFLWNQAGYDFLGDIFGWIIEQLLQLKAWKSTNDLSFSANRIRIRVLELVQSAFFLKHVLDQAASSISHLT